MKRSDETAPIISFLMNDNAKSEQYLKDLVHLIFTRGNFSSVNFHKQKLGKQNYCWTNFVRHWVWEGDNWRVYVSKRGASFEVLSTLTTDEAWLAWQDYFNKVR